MASKKGHVGKSVSSPKVTSKSTVTQSHVQTDPEEMVQVKQLLAAGDPDGVIQEVERGRCRVIATDEIGQSIGMSAANFGYCRLLEYIVARKASVTYKSNEGYTALIASCRAGRPEAVHFLLSKKADTSDRAPIPGAMWTPLHWASINGFSEIVGVLLKAKAAVNATDSISRTPIHWACSHGHLSVVQVLATGGANLSGAEEAAHEHILVRQHVTLALQLNSELLRAAQTRDVAGARSAVDKGAAVDAQDECGWSALMWAALNKQLDMARLLVERGADLDLKDEYGRTAADMASGVEGGQGMWAEVKKYLQDVEMVGREVLQGAARGDLPAVERAIELSPDERGGIDRQDSPGWTAAHWACSRGEPHTLRKLLDRKTDIEKKDSRGLTCALVAACYGRTRLLDMLAEFKANLNAKASHGEPMIFLAARHCQTDTISWILSRAAKDRPWKELWSTDKTGLKADAEMTLHEATACCHLPSIELLLEAEVEMSNRAPSGETVLTKAARSGPLTVVQSLCAWSVPKDFSEANDDGLTPLGCAASHGHSVICETLLDAKAHPSSGGLEGLTSLHLAAIEGHVDVVRTLLLAKADPAAVDSQGRTPLDCIPDLNTPEPEVIAEESGSEAGSGEGDAAEDGGSAGEPKPEDGTAASEPQADGSVEDSNVARKTRISSKDRKSSVQSQNGAESKEGDDADETEEQGHHTVPKRKGAAKSMQLRKSKAKGSPKAKSRATMVDRRTKRPSSKDSTAAAAEELAAAEARAAELAAQEIADQADSQPEEPRESAFEETMRKYLNRPRYPQMNGIEDMAIPRRPKRSARHAEVERVLRLTERQDCVEIWSQALAEIIERPQTGSAVSSATDKTSSAAMEAGAFEEGQETMLPGEAEAEQVASLAPDQPDMQL